MISTHLLACVQRLYRSHAYPDPATLISLVPLVRHHPARHTAMVHRPAHSREDDVGERLERRVLAGQGVVVLVEPVEQEGQFVGRQVWREMRRQKGGDWRRGRLREEGEEELVWEQTFWGIVVGHIGEEEGWRKGDGGGEVLGCESGEEESIEAGRFV